MYWEYTEVAKDMPRTCQGPLPSVRLTPGFPEPSADSPAFACKLPDSRRVLCGEWPRTCQGHKAEPILHSRKP